MNQVSAHFKTGFNCISSFSFFIAVESEHQEAANLQTSFFLVYQSESKNIDASAKFQRFLNHFQESSSNILENIHQNKVSEKQHLTIISS